MQKVSTLDFVYFEAGGGHRTAALALQEAIRSANYPWQVRLVNLQEVLDSLDIFRKITGVRLQDIYNLLLAKGWTLGSRQLLPLMQGVIRMYHRPTVNLLTRYWQQRRPDIVVSLVPNLNRALFESLQSVLPGTPFVTILTDLADFPPHFWIEKQPQYFLCGTHRAHEQAISMGHPSERVFRVSGMILRPDFYEPQLHSRAAERQKLGLNPDLPAGLVLFGGQGSNKMLGIAKRLGNASIDLQLIMICGRNASLRQRLAQLKTRNTMLLEGFTKRITHYMHLSDFVIGKPGPGTISEAMHMRLPVIIERNAWTLPQERYNAEWIEEHGVGIVLKSFRRIESAVDDLLATGKLAAMKQNICSLDNRAVFEIPPILEQLLLKHSRRGHSASTLTSDERDDRQ